MVTGEVPAWAGEAEGGVGEGAERGGGGGEEVPWGGVWLAEWGSDRTPYLWLRHQLNINNEIKEGKTYLRTDHLQCWLIRHLNVPSQQERRILQETVTPLTPHSSSLPSPIRGEVSSTSEPQNTIVRSLANWEHKQELLERQSVNGCFTVSDVHVSVCWLLFWWLISCVCSDTTEEQHREGGVQTEKQWQDQWHQHCWRQYEHKQKVCRKIKLEKVERLNL